MLPRLPEQLRYLLAGLALLTCSVTVLQPPFLQAQQADLPRAGDPVAPVGAVRPGIFGTRPWASPSLAPAATNAEAMQLGVRG